MRVTFASLLLCGASFSYGRVLFRGAVKSSSDNACSTIQPDGTASPHCQFTGPTTTTHPIADVLSNEEFESDILKRCDGDDPTCPASAPKTVIPDLTVLGYQWQSLMNMHFLNWNNILIDSLSISNTVPNMITVSSAYNAEKDNNPKKVALRDIILNMWKYKESRNVADLEFILYENVNEKNMKDMLPTVYQLMGRNMKDDGKNFAKFSLRPRASGNEQIAYHKLLTGTPFAAGASKMLREYSEFGTRQLGNFEFQWTSQTTWSFIVYFHKS